MTDQQERRDNTVLQAILDLTTKVSDIQTELAVNTNETKNVVQRLDKLNGAVAEHARSISTLDQAVVVHTQTLAMLTKSENRKDFVRTGWLEWFLKGLVVITLLLFYAVLTHTGIVQQFLYK